MDECTCKVVIVTKFMKSLSEFVTTPQEYGRGFWIEGPKGTGKTLTLYYLYQLLKQRGEIVLMLWAPEFGSQCLNYLQSWCSGNYLIFF